ncbi:MAG TPA: Smr/MutS family protein [Candidatus Binatia bacterium]|nr:Smr/MutS family protein [Candidatus Binatia bacterium]
MPTFDFEVVRLSMAATQELQMLTGGEPLALPRVRETAESTSRAALGASLNAAELRTIAEALGAAAAAAKRVLDGASSVLCRIVEPHRPLSELVTRITEAIDERGAIRDRASPELGRLRRNAANAEAEARERTTAIARSSRFAKMLQEPIVTVRAGRFVVPVKAEFSGEFPGIVHDTSASGQTLFVEPLGTVEINNRLRSFHIQEEHEIARILTELSGLIRERVAQIEANVEVFAQIDLINAKVRLAAALHAAVPELVDEALIEIVDGRHPLLGERAVPQGFRLDDETRLIVISGPNMGGKTVALKMIGLFVCMAYCGLPLPAAPASRIGRFTRLFTDIGDEQSIAQNTSTFSAHLRRLSEIVDQADARSLILIDEIGSGTEPSAGAALAIAVLERFLSIGGRAVVTTHATELKLFGHSTPHAINASVRFDPQTYAPTFTIDVGTPGQSLAFPLARAMRLEGAVIDRAQVLLGESEREYDRALADLAQQRQEADRERAEAVRESGTLARMRADLQARIDMLEAERRKFVQQAEERLAQRLRDFSRELEERSDRGRSGRVTRSQGELLARTIEEMRHELGLDRARESDAKPGVVALGDRVRVASLDQEGTVVEDYGDAAAVSVGAMRVVVPKAELVRRGAPAVRPVATAATGGVELGAARAALIELDVRGKRYAEAEPVVDQWLDRAILSGFTQPLRLVHGKGTGMLGRGLQEYLRSRPGVKSVRYGNADEGAGGVTIVELADS